MKNKYELTDELTDEFFCKLQVLIAVVNLSNLKKAQYSQALMDVDLQEKANF